MSHVLPLVLQLAWRVDCLYCNWPDMCWRSSAIKFWLINSYLCIILAHAQQMTQAIDLFLLHFCEGKQTFGNSFHSFLALVFFSIGQVGKHTAFNCFDHRKNALLLGGGLGGHPFSQGYHQGAKGMKNSSWRGKDSLYLSILPYHSSMFGMRHIIVVWAVKMVL